MMAAMSDEELATALGQSGIPGLTPEMARFAADTMKSMPPEQLQAMASSAAARGAPGAAPAVGAAAAPAAASPSAQVLEQIRQDPGAIKSMAAMLENMPPEQLEAMAAAVPGAPAGMKVCGCAGVGVGVSVCGCARRRGSLGTLAMPK